MRQYSGLVVDDDTMILKLLTRFFSKFDISILTAENGNQALQIIEKQREEIDFLLTDITMPIMNGEEVISVCSEKYPELPLFIMTGDPSYLSTGFINEGYIQSYFLKPFNCETLIQQIIECLEQNK